MGNFVEGGGGDGKRRRVAVFMGGGFAGFWE